MDSVLMKNFVLLYKAPINTFTLDIGGDYTLY